MDCNQGDSRVGMAIRQGKWAQIPVRRQIWWGDHGEYLCQIRIKRVKSVGKETTIVVENEIQAVREG